MEPYVVKQIFVYNDGTQKEVELVRQTDADTIEKDVAEMVAENTVEEAPVEEVVPEVAEEEPTFKVGEENEEVKE